MEEVPFKVSYRLAAQQLNPAFKPTPDLGFVFYHGRQCASKAA
jgi:hypothetical protein